MKTIILAAIIFLAVSACLAMPVITYDPNSIIVSVEDPNYLLITCVVPVHKHAKRALLERNKPFGYLFQMVRWESNMLRFIEDSRQWCTRNKTFDELADMNK